MSNNAWLKIVDHHAVALKPPVIDALQRWSKDVEGAVERLVVQGGQLARLTDALRVGDAAAVLANRAAALMSWKFGDVEDDLLRVYRMRCILIIPRYLAQIPMSVFFECSLRERMLQVVYEGVEVPSVFGTILAQLDVLAPDFTPALERARSSALFSMRHLVGSALAAFIDQKPPSKFSQPAPDSHSAAATPLDRIAGGLVAPGDGLQEVTDNNAPMKIGGASAETLDVMEKIRTSGLLLDAVAAKPDLASRPEDRVDAGDPWPTIDWRSPGPQPTLLRIQDLTRTDLRARYELWWMDAGVSVRREFRGDHQIKELVEFVKQNAGSNSTVLTELLRHEPQA